MTAHALESMDELPDLAPFQRRLDELDAQMAEPTFYANARRAAEVSREQQKLQQLVADYQEYDRLGREAAEAAALGKDPAADPDLRELAQAELPELERRRAALRQAVLLAMIPPDPTDSRNTVMEIRAGTGGDEASLFAADLFRMYSRYADGQGWKIQPMSSSMSERGGFKEVIFLISGTDVYKRLKFESGVHRVQRVPVTEANGRIHTSTVTVAVLPEAEEVDVQIDPQELEITVTRASGPGGQGVNTTDSAVQIVHKPTGLIVTCADERSQIKNKAKALTVLRSRLLQRREEEERAKYAATRRSQIGSGDRSERIRTYNFPQNRLTDHRIGLTLYNLPQVLEGGIDPIIAALHKADYEEKLAALTGIALPGAIRRAAGGDDE
ncbi:peptide chain release factor 1 [Opitutus terrae]|uniref:Peptide chain release factor 1 n=1 Tax=Opitutus terrae (strain DSM 11246 / JCM 15787 / PB90-1) TaxID=452637 RepID=B1ZVA8_OPITP|nr:peptide chain release factor 1 [Opitutus terrae]ACB76775.1 peptide chain release factor 1 [Opitutus terrae PB90-1]